MIIHAGILLYWAGLDWSWAVLLLWAHYGCVNLVILYVLEFGMREYFISNNTTSFISKFNKQETCVEK